MWFRVRTMYLSNKNPFNNFLKQLGMLSISATSSCIILLCVYAVFYFRLLVLYYKTLRLGSIWCTVTFEGLSVPHVHVVWDSCTWKVIESNAVQARGELPPYRVRFREEWAILGCPWVAGGRSLMIAPISTSKASLWLQRPQHRGPCVYSLYKTTSHFSKTTQVLPEVSNGQDLVFNEATEVFLILVGQNIKPNPHAFLGITKCLT